MSQIIKNSILYSIGEILPRAVSLLLLPIYTRYLSPADYGIISYTHTVVVFLFVLGAFALNSYALRFYFIHEDDEERNTLLGTVQLFILTLNVVFIVLAFLLMPSIINRYDIQIPWNPYFRLAFIINFLDCLSIVPMVIYRVRQDAVKFVIVGLSKTFLVVILTLYLVVFLKRGVLGSFQAQLYVYLPYTLVYLYIMRKYARLSFNFSYIKEGLKFSAPLIPGSICFLLLSVSDRVILERYVDIGELGIYNVACQMSLVLNIVIQSGYKAIEPELFRRFGTEGFNTFIRKTQSAFFSAIYVGALFLCLFSQEIFVLMTTDAFHQGYMLVPALAVGVIMTGQNVIYGGILQGEKRTKMQGTATIIGAIVSVSVNLILIPYFGVYAAACSSALSFFVMNMILFCAMTFPGKTIHREMLLVMLVPTVSYLLFIIFKEISLLLILVKILTMISYSIFALWLLHVDMNQMVKLFVRNRR